MKNQNIKTISLFSVFFSILLSAQVFASSSADFQLDSESNSFDSTHFSSADYQVQGGPAPAGTNAFSNDFTISTINLLPSAAASQPAPICGNNTVETGELCDGTSFNGASCVSLGYGSGYLVCANSCQSFDLSHCDPASGTSNRPSASYDASFVKFIPPTPIDERTPESPPTSDSQFKFGNWLDFSLELPQLPTDPISLPTSPEPIIEQKPPPISQITETHIPSLPPASPKQFQSSVLTLPSSETSSEPPTTEESPQIQESPELPEPETEEVKSELAIEPVITSSITTIDSTPLLVGQLEPNKKYKLEVLTEQGEHIKEIEFSTDPSGYYLYEYPELLNDGTYIFNVNNFQGKSSTAQKLTIKSQKYEDLTIKQFSYLQTPPTNFEKSIDLGKIFITDDQFIVGQGSPQATITAYFQSPRLIVTRAVVQKDGQFALRIPKELEPGTHTVHIVQEHLDKKPTSNITFTFELASTDWSAFIVASITSLLAIGLCLISFLFIQKKHLMNPKKHQKLASLVILALMSTFSPAASQAAVPQTILYEGRLLNSSGTQITTSHTFRISIWKTADWVSGDTTGGGAINTGATNYGGFYEEQTVTPNSNGTFSIQVGSVNPLPSIDYSTHKYLQVEVKASADPVTSYQLMDPTGDNGVDTNDRKVIGSVPYALEAEKAEKTDEDIFVIDSDDSVGAGGNIQLHFGSSLAEALKWDVDNTRFVFTDDVRIEGSAAVVGSVFVADDHSVTDSNGTLNLGLNSSTWENLKWNDTTDQFELSDDLNITGSITTSGTQTKYFWVDTFGGVNTSATLGLAASSKSPVIIFDNLTDSQSNYSVPVPDDWVSGTDITVDVFWSPSDATAGNVNFDFEYASHASGETVASGNYTAATLAAQASPGTALQLSKLSITMPGATFAADDMISFFLSRVPLDVSDTYAANVNIHMIRLSYTGKKIL